MKSIMINIGERRFKYYLIPISNDLNPKRPSRRPMNSEKLMIKHELSLADIQADILIWSDILSDLLKNLTKIDEWSIEVLIDLCNDN